MKIIILKSFIKLLINDQIKKQGLEREPTVKITCSCEDLVSNLSTHMVVHISQKFQIQRIQ